MSTALVLAAAVNVSALTDIVSVRPRADFLAQLIATAAQVPQTRSRRRAEPGEVSAAYGVTEQGAARRPVLLRSL